MKSIIYAGIFCALSLLIFFFSLLINPLYRKHVDIEMQHNKSSCVKIYWASAGQRFSEKNSILVDTHEGYGSYRLRVDTADLVSRIRITPTMKQDIVGISRIAVYQPGYEEMIVESGRLLSLRARKDIAKIELIDKDLRVHTSGWYSQLELKLENVEKSWVAKHMGHFFKVVALGLVSSLIAVFIIAISRFIIYLLSSDSKSENEILSSNILEVPNQERQYNKLLSVSFTAIFIVLMAAFVAQLTEAYSQPNIFGTTQSPYSDALLWLRGTLHLLTDLPFKYRPTLNLFFSSLYSLTQTLNIIPLFGIIFFLINCTLLFYFSLIQSKIYIFLVLLFFTVFFSESIEPLNVGQFMIDFLPFGMTLFGTILVGTGLKTKKKSAVVIMTGLMLIGIAVPLRGVPLLGGAIIVAIVSVALWHNCQRVWALMAPCIFLSPLLLDICLQRYYGNMNSSIFSFFCFYHNPNHSYTTVGKRVLQSMGISDGEVLLTYFRYLFTPEGLQVFWNFIDKLNRDVSSLITTSHYLSLFVMTFVLTLLLNLGIVRERGKILLPFSKFIILSVFLFFLIAFSKIVGVVLLIGCLLLLLFAIATQHYISGSLFAMYIGGLIFFALMGMPGEERVASCYSFGLPLGLLFLLFEDSSMVNFEKTRIVHLIVTVNVFFVVFLYTGSSFLPDPKVSKLSPGMVIKISDDPAINRSLYYDQKGQVFYTERTNESVGKVKQYNEIFCEKGVFNGSFKHPCEIK